MTTIPTTEKFWGTDSFLAYAFPLNSDGSLKATGVSVYEGLEVDGTRNFNITPAEGQTVVNIGNGRLRDTIYRAPRDASRAELTVGYTDMAVKAALSNVNTITVAEMRILGRLTNQQGSEPDTAFFVTQRGHNQNGLTRFKSYLVPKGRVIPRDASMNDNASEETYGVTMSNTKSHLWGKAFTVATDGFTDATYLEFLSEKPLRIVAWLADGAEDTFDLPTDTPASSVAKFTAFNFGTGAEFVAGTTYSVTQIVFDYPPAANTVIIGIYEYDE